MACQLGLFFPGFIDVGGPHPLRVAPFPTQVVLPGVYKKEESYQALARTCVGIHTSLPAIMDSNMEQLAELNPFSPKL